MEIIIAYLCNNHHNNFTANIAEVFWTDAGLVLGQRRRRSANTKPIFVQYPELAG